MQNLYTWSIAILPSNNHIEEVALSISSKQNNFYLHKSLHNLSPKEQISETVCPAPALSWAFAPSDCI